MTQAEKESPKEFSKGAPMFFLMLIFVGFFLYVAIKQNNQISIANLSIFLGVFFVALSSYAVVKTENFCQSIKAFPRSMCQVIFLCWRQQFGFFGILKPRTWLIIKILSIGFI